MLIHQYTRLCVSNILEPMLIHTIVCLKQPSTVPVFTGQFPERPPPPPLSVDGALAADGDVRCVGSPDQPFLLRDSHDLVPGQAWEMKEEVYGGEGRYSEQEGQETTKKKEATGWKGGRPLPGTTHVC
jgi:hypothetical protein